MPFTETETRIYWKLEGEDAQPALVLLNSIGCDMDLWAPALAQLRPHFRLLRIDTRGHGASDAPAGDYSLPMLAGDVLAAMDAAGIDTAAVAGVSLGGMIAMQMALDAPYRVTGVGLVCTSATMDPDAWAARIAKVRGEGMASIAELAMGRFLSPAFAAERPEVAANVLRGLLAMPADGYAGCSAAIRDMAIQPRLNSIECPALVVTGTRDSSTPFEGHGEHLVAGMAGVEHVSLDCAHLAPLDAPAPLAEALIRKFA